MHEIASCHEGDNKISQKCGCRSDFPQQLGGYDSKTNYGIYNLKQITDMYLLSRVQKYSLIG